VQVTRGPAVVRVVAVEPGLFDSHRGGTDVTVIEYWRPAATGQRI